MKKIIWRLTIRKLAIRRLLILVLIMGIGQASMAQVTIPIIGQIVAKVVQAIDLKIQRLQTATIGLQEAQQEAENVMSAARLDEIRDWVQQFKDLYADYFQELWKVKQILADYHKITGIVQRQKDILAGYQEAISLFRQDAHFSAAELAHMEAVYAGILDASLKNLEGLSEVINSFVTQMTDQKRMALIDEASEGMDRNYRDLKAFTNENALLSLQRASDKNEYEFLKQMYGL